MVFDDTNVNETETTVIADQQPEAPAEAPIEQPQVPDKETVQARNFKALREKAERAERERDEAMRRVQELESSNDDKELAEPKEVAQQLRNMKREFSEYKRQTAEALVETRLKAQYADFDNVVSADNIERLRNEYPEIAQTLKNSNDLYSTGVSAYTMIKKFGIHQEAINPEQQQLNKNISKPRNSSSIAPQSGSQGALSHANEFANGLTPELKKQLWSEMEAMRKSF